MKRSFESNILSQSICTHVRNIIPVMTNHIYQIIFKAVIEQTEMKSTISFIYYLNVSTLCNRCCLLIESSKIGLLLHMSNEDVGKPALPNCLYCILFLTASSLPVYMFLFVCIRLVKIVCFHVSVPMVCICIVSTASKLFSSRVSAFVR